jgi:phage terminase small subunit
MPGRTGRRRYTAEEARFAGPKAVADHRRRYGQVPALPPLPEPPGWFTPCLVEIWRNTLAAAAPGSLTALDYDNLAAYCVTVAMYRRLAQRVTCARNPSVELERRLRLAGAELGRASKALGILPGDRVKIPTPPPPPELPDNPHLRSVTLVEVGKVRGVYRVGRK